jgi:hypothetical protein
VKPEIRVDRHDDQAGDQRGEKETEIHQDAPVEAVVAGNAAVRLSIQVFIRSK